MPTAFRAEAVGGYWVSTQRTACGCGDGDHGDDDSWDVMITRAAAVVGQPRTPSGQLSALTVELQCYS